MAKMTLLDIVQAVLSRAEDDEVDSIVDSEPAILCAERAREEYFDMVNDIEWPHLNTLTQLVSVSDVTQPTVLQVPDSVTLMDYEEIIQYDVTTASDDYTVLREIKYMEPRDFMRHLKNRTDNSSNVTKYTGYQGIPLLIITDAMPTYWTSFDDEYVVLDSFDSATESTLQGSKTVVRAKKIPVWTHDDSFIPDLPENLFPMYLSKVTTKYFLYHTQKFNQIDLQETQSGKARQRRFGTKTSGRSTRKTYGRRAR